MKNKIVLVVVLSLSALVGVSWWNWGLKSENHVLGVDDGSGSVTEQVHPLSIDYLRGIELDEDKLTIDEELEAGINYRRYIASYMSDGLKIFGLLTVPDGDKPDKGWPAIIFNHGYIPPEVYRPTERYIAYVDALAREGYVVFRPDYRGHGVSEGRAEGAYGSNAYSIDVLNALQAVRRMDEVNRERVGMWGHSLGGFLTLRAMVVDRGIKAGVIWGGVVGSYSDIFERWWYARDRVNDHNEHEEEWRNRRREQLDRIRENPELIAEISANTYVSDLSGPIQLHHSINDETVPVVLSEILFEQMGKANMGGELYRYENDNHNISNNFSLAMKRTIEFFDVYLE